MGRITATVNRTIWAMKATITVQVFFVLPSTKVWANISAIITPFPFDPGPAQEVPGSGILLLNSPHRALRCRLRTANRRPANRLPPFIHVVVPEQHDRTCNEY